MNREDYLRSLRMHLQGMDPADLEDILSDYREHFDIGLSKGKTEEEISQELGNPRELASNYRPNYGRRGPDSGPSRPSSYEEDNSRKIIISLLLLVFNILVFLGPYLGVWGLLSAVYLLAFGLIVSGCVLFFGLPISLFVSLARPHLLTSLSFGLALAGLGVLAMILAVYLTKLIYRLTLKYIDWNRDLITRGGISNEY